MIGRRWASGMGIGGLTLNRPNRNEDHSGKAPVRTLSPVRRTQTEEDLEIIQAIDVKWRLPGKPPAWCSSLSPANAPIPFASKFTTNLQIASHLLTLQNTKGVRSFSEGLARSPFPRAYPGTLPQNPYPERVEDPLTPSYQLNKAEMKNLSKSILQEISFSSSCLASSTTPNTLNDENIYHPRSKPYRS